MTSPDEQPTQPNPEEPPAGGASAPPPRRLTRSSTDRVIGGVAGGLGRHLGIDPILVRVAFVLLCFAGGLGVLAYLALLAFVPAEDAQPVGQGNRITTLVGAVALAVAAVIFLGGPVFVLGPGLLVLALLAVAVVVVLRVGGGDNADPGRAALRAAVAILAVLAAFGAALGVAFAAALGGGVVIGILTIVTGVALVVAAFLGGARWLIVPALVLALPLAVVAAADIDIKGGIGRREYRPVTMSELQPAYRVGMGEVVLDLRDVKLPAGRTDVALKVGVGAADVLVADNVCVTSDVNIGAGVANVFENVNGGVDVAVAQGGSPSPAQPQLHVKADIGSGQLMVHRMGVDGLGAHPLGVACP
jgi:phage shock protein PspC (stress-responsive transcriptional regulator)